MANLTRDENSKVGIGAIDSVSGVLEDLLKDASTEGLHVHIVGIDSITVPLPSGASTSAKQDTLLTELQLKADLTETQPVSLATVPSHAVTNAGTFAVQSDHAITGIGHGVKTVTTAGTDVALAGSTACKRVTIFAQTDNTGIIAVGASGVDFTVATGTGAVLYPGDAIELDIDNLADIYIDASVSGEGVRYLYLT